MLITIQFQHKIERSEQQVFQNTPNVILNYLLKDRWIHERRLWSQISRSQNSHDALWRTDDVADQRWHNDGSKSAVPKLFSGAWALTAWQVIDTADWRKSSGSLVTNLLISSHRPWNPRHSVMFDMHLPHVGHISSSTKWEIEMEFPSSYISTALPPVA
jgi:hypothetical protein